MLYVVNSVAGHIQILDSNPYPDLCTEGTARHMKKVKMGERNMQWGPTLMKRLSTAIHKVRPRIGVGKFGNWELKLVESAPSMRNGSKDCGFYVWKYIQNYDPYTGRFLTTIEEVCTISLSLYVSIVCL